MTAIAAAPPSSRSVASGAAVAGPLARRGWPTPRTLRVWLILICATVAVLSVVGWRTLVRAREAIHTIGYDTAPGILAAQEVGAALADLDAQEATYLLRADPALRDQATQLFEYRRAEVTKRLLDVARNTAAGDTQRVPIVLMLEGLGRYLEAASRARDAADRGDAVAALDAYRVATDIMHSRILVDAQALDDANRIVMDARYEDERRSSEGMEGIAVACGSLTVAVLLGAQLFILFRMRRVVSVALLVATLLVIGFTSDLARRIGDAREDLRVAKEDSFNSLHILWKARRFAYDANGDERRWLLDRVHAPAWRAAFDTNVRELADDPTGARDDARTVSGGGADHASGLLADETRNVTFSGEREAAGALLADFGDYYADDAKMRAEEDGGRHTNAINLCLGDASAAFDALDLTALRTIEINKTVFDAVIADADHALGTAAWLEPALAIVIALAAWVGIRPRLREYA